MSLLFEPLRLRDLSVTNRAWLAPMCQYSAGSDGVPGDWHLAHLGSFAVGGFGLLLTEATAVVPAGRISPQDVGIWNDEQVAAWRRITAFVHEQGAAIGTQLAHAGRKASVFRPWSTVQGSVPAAEGGWTTLGPTDVPFPGYAAPAAMTTEQVAAVPGQFATAARRAHAAGFDVVELHAAHGYLLHQFLSPLTNTRTDAYGGTPANRARLLVETADAVRAVWPDGKPLLVRVSATDWAPGGLEPADVAVVVKELAAHGVDLVDVSTGGLVPAQVPVAAGYQVPHARTIREASGTAAAAVGLITSAEQAEQVLRDGAADAILLGRQALRDPHWPLRAARELGDAVAWPPQYQRAAWR
ncbi:MAG: NADH:flavin oxidoreductase/NADH oxidase [Promicromonosporaceae bacterium]|nr:NADH:flavin oxidoreductase/NADH oxidase [Promicromonosporaceae bacterium]